MNDPGKLQDEKLTALFDELISRRAIISMSVVGTGYERLTCVVAVEQGSDGQFLLIDQPDGFSQAAAQADLWNLRFNFNGPDQLEYLFSTNKGEFSGRDLKVRFPDYVERLQRRKDFRVHAMPGTRLIFGTKKIEGVIGVINVSLGGAYGVLMQHNQKDLKGSLLAQDQQIYKLGILFPADKEMDELLVAVKKAEVRRDEHDKEKKLYKYAFKFVDMEKDQKQKLTQAIYHIQRQYLRNR
jgi:hypothetical protein